MKKLIVGICAALLGFMSSSALAAVYDLNTLGDLRLTYDDYGSIPKGSQGKVCNRGTLSKVKAVYGDLWLFHTNHKLPWLFTCDGPLETTANKEGVYHWNYDATTDTATCEFQGKWANTYLMTVTVKFTQSGSEILGEVIGLDYPYWMSYGAETYGKASPYAGGMNYYTSLDPSETTGQVRMSLHNVKLDFNVEEGETRHVKFYSKDGASLLKEEDVVYGQAATPPTPPEVEGYVFSKWKPDVSSVKDDLTVTAYYEKWRPANVWLLTEVGGKYYISQGDWKLNVSRSGNSLTLGSYSLHGSYPSSASILDFTGPIIDEEENQYYLTEIGESAFGCDREGVEKEPGKAVAEVRLPKMLGKIGKYAFSNCSKLTNVVFETGSIITNIDYWAFIHCTKLATLTPNLPDTLTYIGEAAFYNTTSLKYPNDVLSLGRIGGTLKLGAKTAFVGTKVREVDILASGMTFPWITFERATVQDFRIHDSWIAPTFASDFIPAQSKTRRYFIPKGMPRSFTVNELGEGDLATYKTKFGADEPEPMGLITLGGSTFFVVEYIDPLLAKDGLLVVADSDNIGAESISPTYGLNKPTRPITCTAPSSIVEFKGVRYMCVGYTLQKLENGILTDVRSSSAKTVTIPEDDDTTYVLKWNWADEGVKLNLVMPTIPFPTDPIGSVLVNGEPGTAESFHALNSTVTLKAVPVSGARFERWEGDVPANQKFNPEIEITMSAAKSVTAIFHANSWLYLPSEEKITDGAWKIGVTCSGTDLTLDTNAKSVEWTYVGYPSVIDLSGPVHDANNASYQIVAMANICFSGVLNQMLRENLADLRMPDTLKTMGNHCCRNLLQMTNLVVSTALESMGESAFYDCHALTTVTPFLPPSLLSLNANPFCITAITNRLTLGAAKKTVTLSASAFHSTQFTEMEILGNLASFGTGYAFGGNAKLRKIWVHSDTPFTSINGNLGESISAGKQVWFIPNNAAWNTWLSTNPGWAAWDESMRADFEKEFPEITKPTPLGKAKFGRAAWQWVVPWSPKRPPLVITIR